MVIILRPIQIPGALAEPLSLVHLLVDLRLTPAQRIKNNDDAVNSVLKFQEAMRRAKSEAKMRAK